MLQNNIFRKKISLDFLGEKGAFGVLLLASFSKNSFILSDRCAYLVCQNNIYDAYENNEKKLKTPDWLLKIIKTEKNKFM